MKKSVLAVMCVSAVTMSYAAESTVSTAQELVDTLTAYNRNGESDNRIYLLSGRYDLSAYEMSKDHAHLSSSNVRLIGKGATARDVVLFGDGSNRIILLVGGGLANLTISNGVSRAGDTWGGGGIYTQIVSEMSNVVVTCCHAVKNGGGTSLGAWYDSVFENNVSDANGGAAVGGVFTRCLFTNNTAVVGGAVYQGATLTDCWVLGNHATSNGGGVAGSGRTADKICNIVGGEIAGNEAGGNGGGVFGVTMKGDVCVHHNTATGSGGGVYNEEAIAGYRNLYWTKNATIHSNTSGKYGGGAWLRNSDLDACVVSNNFAHSADGTDQYGLGGGVYAWDAKVDNSYVLFNRVANENTASNARVWGAGIYSGSASNTVIAGNAIVNCRTATRYGAAAYACALTDCIVCNNYCYGISYGTGGSTVDAGSLSHCVVTNNISIYAVRSAPNVTACLVGGPIFGGVAVNTVFSGYTPWVDLPEGANAYTNGSFYCNTYLFEGSCALTNCLVAGNYSGSFCGPNSAEIQRYANCTFADNAFASYLVDHKNDKASSDFENCLFSENYSTNVTSGRRTRWDFRNGLNSTQVALRNCLMGTSGAAHETPVDYEVNTVTNDNARFVRDLENPYALGRNSPARDRGAVHDWMADATDLRCDPAFPRLRDGKVDIGCYQCWLTSPGLMLLLR